MVDRDAKYCLFEEEWPKYVELVRKFKDDGLSAVEAEEQAYETVMLQREGEDTIEELFFDV